MSQRDLFQIKKNFFVVALDLLQRKELRFRLFIEPNKQLSQLDDHSIIRKNTYSEQIFQQLVFGFYFSVSSEVFGNCFRENLSNKIL